MSCFKTNEFNNYDGRAVSLYPKAKHPVNFLLLSLVLYAVVLLCFNIIYFLFFDHANVLFFSFSKYSSVCGMLNYLDVLCSTSKTGLLLDLFIRRHTIISWRSSIGWSFKIRILSLKKSEEIHAHFSFRKVSNSAFKSYNISQCFL